MGAPHERLLGAIEVALGEVSLEGLPGRRRVDRPAPAILGAIAGPLETILRDARTGRAAPSYAVAMSTAFTPALGSLLFAYGAPHPTWRRWTAIAAVGEALDGGWCAAVTLGAIAHAWDLVDRVPTVSEGYDASWAALFRLLGKEPAIDPTTARDEPEAIALWAALVEDHARGRDPEPALARVIDRARALDDRVGDDVVAMTDPSGEHLHPTPWSATTESGTAAAAVAILARRGWAPSPSFGDERRRFVEPGLAPGAAALDVGAILGW